MNQGRSATRAQSGANGCAVPYPRPGGIVTGRDTGHREES